MKIEDIKAKYSMFDILARYNINVKRGFCKCPFHKGDNTPSMKVYKDGFYCFGCGAGGDIIKFVQLHDRLKLDDACKWISGEELTRRTKYQLAVARVRKNNAARNEDKCRQELKYINAKIGVLWQKFLDSEPLSDEWTQAYNKWQLLAYKQEQILRELGAK